MNNDRAYSFVDIDNMQFTASNHEPHTVRKFNWRKFWLDALIFTLEMALYMCRWQLSTFTMTPVILFAKHIGIINSWAQVSLANLFSAPFFFFVDKFILVYVRKLLLRLIDWLKRKRELKRI